MPSLTSKDGTVIAYDKVGNGPVIIFISGALSYRALTDQEKLAELFAKRFTVIFYDRRGRGESEDRKPYSVEREIDDIEALIDEAGGKAFLHGSSSGAALALLAARRLGPDKVTKLSLYEPPYDAYIKDGKNGFAKINERIKELVAEGKNGDAISFFFESIGTPPDGIQAVKSSPGWNEMEKIGNTLVYDFEILGSGTIPVDVAKKITIPTQVLNGDKSLDFMHSAADKLAAAIPDASRKTLKDQTHQASAEALFPMLSDFFSKGGRP